MTVLPMSVLTTPLEYALEENSHASAVDCALTKWLDLKCPGINNYKNMGVAPLLKEGLLASLTTTRHAPGDAPASEVAPVFAGCLAGQSLAYTARA